MDWSWAIEGVTEEVPRSTGLECINYMTNRRRWTEAVLLTTLFIFIIRAAMKNLAPITLPPPNKIQKPHSTVRLILLIAMTFTFGIEIGFKFATKSVIFALNPCHVQTLIQIYLLAAKPSKLTVALFRIQMNNLNGPILAFLFPEVESRTLPFEQCAYWIQHALLYIIPVYILKTGAYDVEDFYDYNWTAIGVAIMLLYHFVFLNALSMLTSINLSHMLCAALSDPFQGQNYRIAAVIHESILCPILNKATVFLFNRESQNTQQVPLGKRAVNKSNQAEDTTMYHQLKQHLMLEAPLASMEVTKTAAAVKAVALPAVNKKIGDSYTMHPRSLTQSNHDETDGTEPVVSAPPIMTSGYARLMKSD